MSAKLMWVLLPVVLAGIAVGLLALRGRLPSRAVLNVWFSLLLMAYLLTTAGLGIFWVANQQLPVFDWHYVFGYSTLVLVALHLGFNFRVVWSHLTRRRRRAAAAPLATPAAVARRPVLGALGWLGAAAAGGSAFYLGLRHGRTELRVTAGAPATPAATGLAVVEQFHAFSSHSRAGLLRRAPSVDWGSPPAPFKPYRGHARLALPAPTPAAGSSWLDRSTLGTLLWHAVGVSEQRGGLLLRTSPSSGALFATELYVAVRAADGIAPGLWYYHGGEHALVALQEGEPGAALLPPGAAAAVWATAIFRRSGHKYGDRTYRYLLADLGHALENLRVAAAELGGTATLQPRFDESLAAAALGVDESEEGVLAMALLHAGASRQPAALAPPDVGSQGAPPWRPPALTAADGAALGVTDLVHRATSLRAASAAAMPSASTTMQSLALPAPRRTQADGLGVIARRRSRRRFGPAALSQDDLSAVLAAMTGPLPQLSRALRIDVLTQAVQGLPAAAWRHDPRTQALALRQRHDADGLRRRSRAAALDQDVIGDAAVVFVLSIAREDFAADASGPARGYRHAFLEAGMAGERVYLEAGARGLAACAVGAFYDDEISALLGGPAAGEWVVHLAALGAPA